MLVETIWSVILLQSLRAFLLPLAKRVDQIWTWLYTAAAPKDVRDDQRAEMYSDLYGLIDDHRRQGYGPESISFHLFLRILRGMKDDVAWAWPHSRDSLAARPERGSESLRHMGRAGDRFAAIAALCFMNVLILGDQGMALNEWLISNVAMISFLALYLNSKRSWARRILHFWIALAALGVLIVSTYVVIDHRLYELPAFNQIMMAGSLAFLPLTVLMIVTGSTIRTRVFRNRLWPIFLSASLATISSLAISSSLGLTADLMNVWTIMAILTMTAFFLGLPAVAAALLVRRLTAKGGAAALDMVANQIKRRV